MDEGGFSGACLVRRGADTLFSAACGLASREHQVPNTTDTRFDTASVTKVYTAAGILLLAQEGRLSLSAPITSLVDLAGTRISPEVTVEMLLNHTSGIADDADEEAGEDYSALFVDRPNYSIRQCADFLPMFAYKEPMFPPGTAVRYNNCAFVLLGLTIEAVAGEDYRGFISRRVFAPCGLQNTLFAAKDEINPGVAEGYFGDYDSEGKLLRWRKNIYAYPPVGTADAGAYTTVGDMDRFVRAVKGGCLLDAAHTAMLFSPHCAFTRAHHIRGVWRTGYAFEFQELAGEPFCIYKEGVNAGVYAMMSYYPALDATLMMLANQDGPFWRAYNALQDVLYDDYCDL